MDGISLAKIMAKFLRRHPPAHHFAHNAVPRELPQAALVGQGHRRWGAPGHEHGAHHSQLPGDLTTAKVEKILQACKAKAAAINCPMNISVCDAHLEMKGFLRMDGAWIGSIDIAMKKARTSRDFNMDTRDIGPLCQPGQPLYGIEHSNKGLITFGGGVLLKNATGTVVGAIGVSGGSVEQDHEVAAAGIACAK